MEEAGARLDVRYRQTACFVAAALQWSGDTTAATHHNQLFRFISDHGVEPQQRRSRVQCRGAPGGCSVGGGGARSRGTGREAVISSCNSLM